MGASARPEIGGEPAPTGGGFVARVMARARARAAAVQQGRLDAAKAAVDKTKPPLATPAVQSATYAAAAAAGNRTRAAAKGSALGKPY